MNILGIYVYNSDKHAWLQCDRRTWGSWGGAGEFIEEDVTEAVREQVSGEDTTFTMAALH